MDSPIQTLLLATKQKEREARVQLASLEGQVAAKKHELVEHVAVKDFIEEYQTPHQPHNGP